MPDAFYLLWQRLDALRTITPQPDVRPLVQTGAASPGSAMADDAAEKLDLAHRRGSQVNLSAPTQVAARSGWVVATHHRTSGESSAPNYTNLITARMTVIHRMIPGLYLDAIIPRQRRNRLFAKQITEYLEFMTGRAITIKVLININATFFENSTF